MGSAILFLCPSCCTYYRQTVMQMDCTIVGLGQHLFCFLFPCSNQTEHCRAACRNRPFLYCFGHRKDFLFASVIRVHWKKQGKALCCLRLLSFKIRDAESLCCYINVLNSWAETNILLIVYVYFCRSLCVGSYVSHWLLQAFSHAVHTTKKVKRLPSGGMLTRSYRAGLKIISCAAFVA